MPHQSWLLKGGMIVNEGTTFAADILIKDGRIAKIGSSLQDPSAKELNVEGLHILPGAIDDQVHFREPGLTHKATIGSEAMAAIAGGVTSFMEMPNTNPPALTQELLEDKYQIGAATSMANYSFFMGTSNDNFEAVMKTNPKNVCGVKIFMGSSTGNMLVDSEETLRKLFANVPMLIAAHCEVESIVQANLKAAKAQFGENVPMNQHPLIRSSEACYHSSSFAINLAKEYNTRFHVLHLTTAEETHLFTNAIPLEQKRITAEVCVHHLHFNEEDYAQKGADIKCNPAVKTETDRQAIWEALLDDRIDIIATDHAPHTRAEKDLPYFKAPSGLPLIQHAVPLMLDYVAQGVISIERMVHKMSHAPAICFQVAERGFIREGYKADLAIVNLNQQWTVNKDNVLYKCGWSPFEGHTFTSKVVHTFVNGNAAMIDGVLNTECRGERLLFNRNL
jgi:dihydroorotase